MAVDGTYKVEVSMPEGFRTLLIILKTEGNTLGGSVNGPFGQHDFKGGSIKGNDVAWTVVLTPESVNTDEDDDSEGGFFEKLGSFVSDSLSEFIMEPPHPDIKSTTVLPVEFKASIAGDEIMGEMKFGDYAPGMFRGIRSQE
ncbi:MAG: hypothetical protein JSU79_10145 [Dehalococcoidales bacterium]|nr:MAG: hypothetical protein JSU79_10145 [Dehalococcoidales bacterium]